MRPQDRRVGDAVAGQHHAFPHLALRLLELGQRAGQPVGVPGQSRGAEVGVEFARPRQRHLQEPADGRRGEQHDDARPRHLRPVAAGEADEVYEQREQADRRHQRGVARHHVGEGHHLHVLGGDVAHLVCQYAGEFAGRQVAGERVGDGDGRVLAPPHREGVHHLRRHDVELRHRRQLGPPRQFFHDAVTGRKLRPADRARLVHGQDHLRADAAHEPHRDGAEHHRIDDAAEAREGPGGDGEQEQAAPCEQPGVHHVQRPVAALGEDVERVEAVHDTNMRVAGGFAEG